MFCKNSSPEVHLSICFPATLDLIFSFAAAYRLIQNLGMWVVSAFGFFLFSKGIIQL